MHLNTRRVWVIPLAVFAALSLCVRDTGSPGEVDGWLSDGVVRPVTVVGSSGLPGFDLRGSRTESTVGPLELSTADGSIVALPAATPVTGDCELLRLPSRDSDACWLLIGFDDQGRPRVRVLEPSGIEGSLIMEGLGSAHGGHPTIDGFMLEAAASLYVQCADARSLAEWEQLGEVPDAVAYIDTASGQVTTLGCAEPV